MAPISTPAKAAALLLSLSLPVVAQNSATTAPLTVIDVTIPAAVSATEPSSQVLSIPLLKPADFQGKVQSLDSASAFTITGASFVVNQLLSPPRLVRVKSSTVPAHVGRFFIVTGNTAAQVTVSLAGTGLANINAAVSVGDACEIVPANTLGNVFGTAGNPPPFKPGATANEADNLYLWNGTVWDTYYWTGSVGTPANIWKLTGNNDRSNTVIFPDDGLFVIRRGATPLTLSLLGRVPTTAEQSPIAAAGGTFLSNRFPVDTTLGGLGLQSIPGWQAAATANSGGDAVLLWNPGGSGWDTYFWTGTVGTPNNIWKRTGNTDRSSTPIPVGSAIYVTRSGGPLTVTHPLPYTP